MLGDWSEAQDVQVWGGISLPAPAEAVRIQVEFPWPVLHLEVVV